MRAALSTVDLREAVKSDRPHEFSRTAKTECLAGTPLGPTSLPFYRNEAFRIELAAGLEERRKKRREFELLNCHQKVVEK
ncbi:hypothetical protein J5N97_016073 [Dioscorea zingiberensis]|uniref:Uncharacterized protein n=1 Tax=Dioscorea zingiberensis TaxID=325984 RepID=A0A9D5CKE3_9LILI|nr:hypothetical protein J5N97_016073 [Dioscorea zingiberensis]